MPQHFLTVKGIPLSVTEHHPEFSPTIFFIHGNSTSSRAWDKQVADPRFAAYRLVTIDLPAHGDSGDSNDPATDYNLPGLGAIVADAIKALAKGPYLICGISLATNIMTEMIPHGISPLGMFYAGSCIMGEGLGIDKVAIPGVDLSALAADEVPAEAVSGYRSKASLSVEPGDTELFLSDFQRVRSPFRSLFFQSLMKGHLSDGIALVKGLACPQAWIFGADEQVVDPHYLDEVPVPKWRGRCFLIPGASHLVNTDAPEPFNALLGDFAGEVFGR
jgi:pimeloyl-ACP methyl ester carboxylesterase